MLRVAEVDGDGRILSVIRETEDEQEALGVLRQCNRPSIDIFRWQPMLKKWMPWSYR